MALRRAGRAGGKEVLVGRVGKACAQLDALGGAFGGGLADIEPAELAGTAMKEAISRSGVDAKQINYVTVGNCIPTDSRFAYG